MTNHSEPIPDDQLNAQSNSEFVWCCAPGCTWIHAATRHLDQVLFWFAHAEEAHK